MKNHIIFSMTIIAFATLMASCSPNTIPQQGKKMTWTCPMHPEVISDKPGTCPKCGMDLVADNGKSGHNHKCCKMNSGGSHDHSGGGCGMMR